MAFDRPFFGASILARLAICGAGAFAIGWVLRLREFWVVSLYLGLFIGWVAVEVLVQRKEDSQPHAKPAVLHTASTGNLKYRMTGEEWILWFSKELERLRSGEEIRPPWDLHRDSDPTDYRQGGAEAWLDDVWLVYMNRLSPEAQMAYLDKWQAPDQWREFVAAI